MKAQRYKRRPGEIMSGLLGRSEAACVNTQDSNNLVPEGIPTGHSSQIIPLSTILLALLSISELGTRLLVVLSSKVFHSI